MYGFPLAISCCVKISNIPSKFVKYIDVPLFKAMYGFPLAISCCVKISNIPSKFVKYIDVPLLQRVYVILLKKTNYKDLIHQ